MGADRPRFATVVFDVDSTLSGIEGIDWLAARRGDDVAARVRALTDDAMSGRVRLEDVYGERLALVAPAREDVAALAEAYRAAVAPGAAEAIELLRRAGVRVIAVSGGLRDAIVPLCTGLLISADDVHGVAVRFDASGRYAGFDAGSPLARQDGKAAVLRARALPRPVLAVGDGSTDLAMKSAGAAGAFAAYTGFVRREPVVLAADWVLRSYGELAAAVLERTAG